jgi:hypothetical protein
MRDGGHRTPSGIVDFDRLIADKAMKHIWKLTTSSVAVGLTLAICARVRTD